MKLLEKRPSECRYRSHRTSTFKGQYSSPKAILKDIYPKDSHIIIKVKQISYITLKVIPILLQLDLLIHKEEH